MGLEIRQNTCVVLVISKMVFLAKPIYMKLVSNFMTMNPRYTIASQFVRVTVKQGQTIHETNWRDFSERKPYPGWKIARGDKNRLGLRNVYAGYCPTIHLRVALYKSLQKLSTRKRPTNKPTGYLSSITLRKLTALVRSKDSMWPINERCEKMGLSVYSVAITLPKVKHHS